MNDPPNTDFYRSWASRVRKLPDDEAAMILEQLYELGVNHGSGSTAPSNIGRTRRPRRRRRPPVALLYGITAVNRIREIAAEAAVRRSARAAARDGVSLAPARAMRKIRGGQGYALTGAHRGAVGILHAPAWVLPQVDDACQRALVAWVLGRFCDAPPAPADLVPGISPGDALVIGALFELVRYAPKVTVPARMLLEAAEGPELGITGPLKRFAASLARRSEWKSRIRRCDYDAGQAEGCYVYFLDRSPKANAAACSPGHAVRLAEARRPAPP